ncbi:transketolase [Polynucleobacter sp. MWH-UH24A]|uniref:transketolase n=1 Tax=Polynucleobacter sp. MWH-UH24A TaxID=2689110 RepID=UPI001BFE2F90|nr:transketolase [Polynucleobacter sp. MWH-UH24A]QWD76410.1 transketolase [Polynucleobacter sp. MWH-UH24A]
MKISSKELSKNIRINALKMVTKANASHIGSALSIADIVGVLYADVLKIFPRNPKNPCRDRLILSKGHACVTIYAALAEMKFFPKKNLETYGDDFSLMMNHISHKVPGVEFSSGSLGHGLPFGVGKALYAKRRNLCWRVFVILSDGELNEGSNWEALMFASHHQLCNLTVIVDYNKLQSLTSIDKTLALEPLSEKFRSFGADVVELNGHDHVMLSQVLKVSGINRPKVIIAHTIKGKGVSFMENQVLWHYRSPNNDELLQAIKEIESENA